MFGSCTACSADLRIGPLAATRKACAPEVMAREGAFGNVLEKSRIYLRAATRLTLKDAQGVTTMRPVQKDWD